MSLYVTDPNGKLVKIAGGGKVIIDRQQLQSTIEGIVQDKLSTDYYDKDAVETKIQESTNTKADTSYVDQKVADLVGGAPDTLDTLEELANALKDNADVADVLEKAIGNKADKTALTELSNVVKTKATMSEIAPAITFAESERQKSTTDGGIVHKNDIQPNILTASLISNYNFEAAKTEEILPLSQYNNVGNKLSMSNNKVVIGEGVTKVKVSYIGTIDGKAPNTNCYFYLNKNTTRITISQGQHPAEYAKVAIPCTPFVLSVVSGDTLHLSAYTNSINNYVAGSSSLRTYMTVEVIE